jgi:hypothetical protein
MRHYILKLLVPALASVALAAVLPSQVRAQNRAEDGHDQHDQAPADHGDEHPGARTDERSDAHPDAHRNVGRPDPVVRYRHDHPHASARCHDGFFTTTSDRSRACRKHGGIDVWLVL